MRTFAILATTALALAPAPAHASGPGPGLTCSYAAVTDLQEQFTVETGVLLAGPLGINSGSITCTIQVGRLNDTHAGTDAYVVTGPTTSGVALVLPTQVVYSAAPEDEVYLCTRANLTSGQTLYWDADGSGWQSANTVACNRAARAAFCPSLELPPDCFGRPTVVVSYVLPDLVP